MGKSALITGITGQDGSYLAEYLLGLGYQVIGMVRRTSLNRMDRIDHIKDQIEIESGDLSDQGSITNIINEHLPDEIYNLASQSFVYASWKSPIMTGNFTGLGAARVLEAARILSDKKDFKIYQASSSEMFGKVREVPQNENTPFYPRSPYGVAKVYAYWISVNYRESYDMFVSNGIMYNHESPRRGIEFVTKKITDGVAQIVTGKKDKLVLGNLDAKRDWGYAKDYVEAMHTILQQDIAEDFVICTGEMHSIREFCDTAFSLVDLDYQDYVKSDPKFMRPAEVHSLIGDSTKAREKLGWESKTSFADLVKIMLKYDLSIHCDDKHFVILNDKYNWLHNISK